MNYIILITIVVFLIISIVLLFQYVARYIYGYQLREAGIEIVLFGRIPLKLIHFSNISEIRKISYAETLISKSVDVFMALRLGNRVFGDVVLIRRKKGLIKVILITPDDADKFIKDAALSLKKTEN